MSAGLIFYRLYDPKKSTKHDLVKVLAHLITICAASVGEQKSAATALCFPSAIESAHNIMHKSWKLELCLVWQSAVLLSVVH